jgi:hypothetical protein
VPKIHWDENEGSYGKPLRREGRQFRSFQGGGVQSLERVPRLAVIQYFAKLARMQRWSHV